MAANAVNAEAMLDTGEAGLDTLVGAMPPLVVCPHELTWPSLWMAAKAYFVEARCTTGEELVSFLSSPPVSLPEARLVTLAGAEPPLEGSPQALTCPSAWMAPKAPQVDATLTTGEAGLVTLVGAVPPVVESPQVLT